MAVIYCYLYLQKALEAKKKKAGIKSQVKEVGSPVARGKLPQ